MSVIERFNEIYIHDSNITNMAFDLKNKRLTLDLDCAGIPKEVHKGIDYEIYYEPAQLEFHGVQQVKFPEHFCYDRQILTYEIRPSETEGYYCFSMMIHGGPVGGVWARPIEIIAKDFKLGGNLVNYKETQEEWKRNNHY